MARTTCYLTDMDTTTAPATTQISSPARCTFTDEFGLGCARNEHAEGSHWLTSQPAAANADLRRQGFWSRSIPAEGPVR